MPNYFKSLIRLSLRLYQGILSPLLGGQCRFYPSCSSYALEAFEKFSIGVALKMVIKRILSCHPGHPGGVDLVSEKRIS